MWQSCTVLAEKLLGPQLVVRLWEWRHNGLVVSMLDFQSGGLWFKPSLCHRHMVIVLFP